MYIDYEKIGNILGFGQKFFYNMKVAQNCAYIKRNIPLVKQRLKNKKKLKVLFYVYDSSRWKSQSVYDLMLKDERFEPLIVVTKNCAQENNANFQDSKDVLKNYQFFKVYDEHQLEYVLVVKGGNDDIHLIGKMVTFQIQGLLTAYKERFDKDNFIKNLLLDNLLLVDIYNRAKKLHIEVEARRLVFILETNPDKNSGALESVKSLLGTKSGDFITAVDEKNIIIVKELAPGEDYAQMNKVAATILEAAGRDEEGKTHVAYGTIVKEIKEVSRSYKEARMAMDVGKIFSAENDIYAYSSLGIGRLIYQLPIPLCKMFIKEIFGNKSPDDFDEETLTTINKFFENSLNVSETSRQLYIHRNTLVYRLG